MYQLDSESWNSILQRLESHHITRDLIPDSPISDDERMQVGVAQVAHVQPEQEGEVVQFAKQGPSKILRTQRTGRSVIRDNTTVHNNYT